MRSWILYDLMAFKRSFAGPIPAKQEHRYREKGIDTFHAAARFAGPNVIEADGERLQARHFLIATGARPVPLAFPGAEHLITTEEFLDLDELPNRIVLVGGGYIAAEFSHIAAHAGAKVTVLQRANRMLPHFDPDLVGWLMESFQRAGIDVRTQHVVEAVEKTASGFVVRARTQNEQRAFALERDANSANPVTNRALGSAALQSELNAVQMRFLHVLTEQRFLSKATA